MRRRNDRASAFTLVELLVVIAIIGVLIALLLPAIQSAREAARRSQCQNNLKQLGVAAQLHHDVNKRLPMGRNRSDQLAVSWAFYSLPFLEEKAVFAAHVNTVPGFDDKNKRTMRSPIAVFACPSRRSAAANRNFDNNDGTPTVLAAATLGDYAANAGYEYDTAMDGGGNSQTFGTYDQTKAGPIFSGSKIAFKTIRDGLAKTLAIGERHIPPVPAGTATAMAHYEQADTAFISGDHPRTIFAGVETGLAAGPKTTGLGKFGSTHSGVTQFVFLDAHVSSINNDIPQAELFALSTIAGSDTVRQKY